MQAAHLKQVSSLPGRWGPVPVSRDHKLTPFLAKDHRKMLRVQDFLKRPSYCVDLHALKKKKKKKEQNESLRSYVFKKET